MPVERVNVDLPAGRALRFSMPSATLSSRQVLGSLLIFLATSHILYSSMAYGAAGSAEPGQVPPKPTTPLKPIAPPAPERAPEKRPEKAITLTGVSLSGATVYKLEELAPLYEDYLGVEIKSSDIAKILAAITKKYRRDGYMLSRAITPQQVVDLGILRIKIIEGFVDKVTLAGEVPKRRSLLNAYGRNISAERPLTLSTLERYVLLFNQLPGFTAEPKLREIKGADGAFELIVKLDYDPAEGFMGLDNRGSRAVGPLQSYAGVSLHSSLGMFENTRFKAFSVPDDPDELIFAELFHDQPIGDEGTRLGLSVWRSEIDTVSESNLTRLEGKGTHVSLSLSHPIILGRESVWTATARFDYLNSKLTEPDSATNDRVRSLRIETEYSFLDGLKAWNFTNLGVSKGFDFLEAKSPGSDNLSNDGGRGDYIKLTAGYWRDQPIIENWSVYLASSGQITPNVLLSSEEFSVGGGLYGRAYGPSEISSYNGTAGAIELRYNGETDHPLFKTFRVFSFYELGAVWDENSNRDSVASTGLGLSLDVSARVSATAEWAFPLTRPVESEGDNAGRFFFRLNAVF